MPSITIYRKSRSYRIFEKFNWVGLGLLMLILLFPILNVISVSMSSPNAVISGKVGLFPIGLNFKAYARAIEQPYFLRSFVNSILYTVVGGVISLVLTTLCAYPLSKKIKGRTAVIVFIMITMFFNGGMIPNFLLIRRWLGLSDTMWAIVLPFAINQFTMIILMTFFKGIPQALEEAAAIDGYNPIQILIHIIIPLAIPGLVTVVLFNSLFLWNNWFHALLYLDTATKFPVMLILRNLVQGGDMATKGGSMSGEDIQFVSASLKSAAIVISAIPMTVLYLIGQKYFIKGVMLGSLKE
jgi:putative aldouronate transport system permease protein